MAERIKPLFGMGRRKSARARVFLKKGKGKILINKRELPDYFPLHEHKVKVCAALEATENRHALDMVVNVDGGGIKGQAEAILLGSARALLQLDEKYRSTLKPLGYLTRDSRMVERKKYGQRGARRKFQFTKR